MSKSKESIRGVHDVTIKLYSGGRILLRSLAFEKSKMYFSEFHLNNEEIKGKLQDVGDAVAIAVYTSDGQVKDVKIYKNVDGCSDFEIKSRNEDYILKIFGFENFENLKPIDKVFLFTKQKEDR